MRKLPNSCRVGQLSRCRRQTSPREITPESPCQYGRQLPGQSRIAAKGRLDASHLLDGQCLIQVGFKIALAEEVGHGK